MKVITENLLLTAVASSEQSTFEADNLLDDEPGFVWKGDTASETLTFTLAGGTSNALGIVNTNATRVSFQIVDPNFLDLESTVDLEASIDLASNVIEVTEIINLDGVSGACLAMWPDISAPLTVIVSLTNDNNEPVYAGCASAGLLLGYNDPNWTGFREGQKRNHFVKKYPGGGRYAKRGTMPRYFQMTIALERNTDFHSFLFDVDRKLGPHPGLWLITDENNSRWLIYGVIEKEIRGNHNPSGKTFMTIYIEEVIE